MSNGDATPQERLRSLELSGDPDAQQIAQRYKSGPLNPSAPFMRALTRQMTSPLGMIAPSYAQATTADADEAEAAVAALRGRREQERRTREEQLFAFARAADRRETLMIVLTVVAIVVSAAALVATIVA